MNSANLKVKPCDLLIGMRPRNARVVKKLRIFGPVLATMLTIGVSACSAAPSTEESARDHASVVSLNPCIDAILVEIANAEQVLALSHYSRNPQSTSMDTRRAEQFGVTGGTAEEVLALRPDIVLAGSFIAPATKNAFERLGMRVETFGSPTNVEGSYAQIRNLAEIIGDGARGDDFIAEIKKMLGPEKDDAARREEVFTALVWQSGQIVAGRETLLTELLRRNGFVSHADENGLGQGEYVSLERVLADPPDLLLIAGDSLGQEHPTLGNLTETRVEKLEPNLLYCAGLTIPKLNDRLAAIHRSMMQERGL